MKKLTLLCLFLFLNLQSKAIGLPTTPHPTVQAKQIVVTNNQATSTIVTNKLNEECNVVEEETKNEAETTYAKSIIDRIVTFVTQLLMSLFSSKTSSI